MLRTKLLIGLWDGFSVPVGASVVEIKDNIAELKIEFVSLFTAAEEKEDPQPGNPGSRPSGAPRKPVLNNESFSDLGARLAKEEQRQTEQSFTLYTAVAVQERQPDQALERSRMTWCLKL